MGNLIEMDEVRERVGVFLVEKPGKDTLRLITISAKMITVLTRYIPIASN